MWSFSGAERCTKSEEEKWPNGSVSILVFELFVRCSHWFLLLYCLRGDVTYHHFLDPLRSQRSLRKLSTAACAQAHILLERVRLTLLYTRLPCKKKKKKKNIIRRSILIYCCCLHVWKSRMESRRGNFTHAKMFFFLSK